jgi:hypothetical protein
LTKTEQTKAHKATQATQHHSHFFKNRTVYTLNKDTQAQPIQFLTVKDLQRIYPQLTSYSGAWKAYHRLKECIGKANHQKLTAADLAAWEGLPVEAITNALL